MELFDILKDAVEYPFKDMKTFLIIGILLLVASLLSNIGSPDELVYLIPAIISILIILVVEGYCLSVLGFGIDLRDDLPAVDFKKNFIDGIKVLVVNIVYYIIPAIISIVLMIATLGLAVATSNLQFVNPADGNEILAQIVSNNIGSIIGVGIIIFILAVIFSLLAIMGQARLAKTGDILEAINFGHSYNDLKNIGIGKTIAFVILLFILMIVVLFIFMILLIIPIIGLILLALFGEAYIKLIQSRAYGLFYSEIA